MQDDNNLQKLVCTKCKQELPLTDFRSSGSRKYGQRYNKTYWCKTCWKQRERLQRRTANLKQNGPYPDERKDKAKVNLFWCNTCSSWQQRSNFSNNRAMSDGRNHFCKTCGNIKAKKDNKKASYKFAHYKASAKRCNRIFSLTFDEFMNFWQQPCWYCGEPISTIGIDRKDNQVGYILANCVSCCTFCNMKLKRALNINQFLDRVRRIAELHPLGVIIEHTVA